MKVEVQPIYEQGKSASAAERAAASKYRGQLCLREERIHALGRTTTVAALISEVSGTEESVLPVLHDANVLSIDGSRVRIRGFELVGNVEYAQVWDVKVT